MVPSHWNQTSDLSYGMDRQNHAMEVQMYSMRLHACQRDSYALDCSYMELRHSTSMKGHCDRGRRQTIVNKTSHWMYDGELKLSMQSILYAAGHKKHSMLHLDSKECRMAKLRALNGTERERMFGTRLVKKQRLIISNGAGENVGGSSKVTAVQSWGNKRFTKQ